MSLSQLRIQTKIIALILTFVAGMVAFSIASNAQKDLVLQSVATPVVYAQSDAVVNGMCGVDHEATVSLTPSASRACASGVLTALSYTGSGWTWNCIGEGGGTDSIALSGTGLPATSNTYPTANAGDNIIIEQPVNSARITGAVAEDVEGAVTFFWEKVSGPAGGWPPQFSDTVAPRFNDLNTVGIPYEYQLTVTDDEGYVSSDTVQILVVPASVNLPPSVNAGGPISIPTGGDAEVTGATAVDPENDPLTFDWVQTDGPSGASISDRSLLMPTFTDLLSGQNYEFELTVSDDNLNESKDTVVVTVGNGSVPSSFPDLTADSVSIQIGAADGINGTWTGSTVQLVIGNLDAINELPGTSDVPYRSTIDLYYVAPAHSPDMTSDLDYESGPISFVSPSRVINQSIESGVIPFGAHNVCLAVNLEGVLVPELAANTSNNTRCLTQIIPVPTPPMDIRTNNELIRIGEDVMISWSAETSYLLNCTVSGAGGLNETFRANVSSNGGGGTTGSFLVSSLNNTSEFTIQCVEPITGSSFSDSVTVEVVPNLQEF